MATAFQANAFQTNAFQIDATPGATGKTTRVSFIDLVNVLTCWPLILIGGVWILPAR